MDEISQVKQSDIDYAKALLQRASPALTNLLEAKEAEEKKE